MGALILLWMRFWAVCWSVLPRQVQLLGGNALGAFLRVTRFRLGVVHQNIAIAYPSENADRSPRHLIRDAYRHLGNLFLEIWMLLGCFRRFCEANGELKGLEHWKQAKAQGRGVIMLASHLGNWEVMLATGAMQGIDIMMVTKRLKPAWLHAAIESARAKCGVRATYEPRTFRDVLTALKHNETVGFVLDQYAGPPVGVRVPFFGVPVGTQTAVATLVKRTGAVILPVMNHRTKEGKFVVEIQSPLPWLEEGSPEEDLARNTARYAMTLESHIRQYPSQWLWTHRRFKGELGPLRPGEWQEGRPRK